MSYILEALRKSDQQRQRGAAPTLHTAPPPMPVSSQSRGTRNALLAVALLGAGILLGWLRPWQLASQAPATVHTPPPAANLAPAASPPLAVPQAPARQAESETPAPAPSPAPRHAPVDSMASAPHDLPPPIRIEPTRPPLIVTPDIRKDAVAMDIPPPVVPSDVKPETKAIPQSELPASIQREIPVMSIALHAYAAAPGDRMVMINDRMLRQGDTLAAGLRLEQITPDGLILGYKGYRFFRSVR